ncbi:MAG: hypothetical protein BIFFINMI_01688 [Phycisphaerae bacterium]|nr:hypothetical protein [Phycisphaerae bacterium]
MTRTLLFAFVLLVACTGGVLIYRALAVRRPAQPDGRTITVIDLAGRTVTLRQPIRRIVLLRSRDVYDLSAVLGDELPDRLVGWGDDVQLYDTDAYRKYVERFPSLAGLPVVGSVVKDSVSTEAVLALDPDLVIIEASSGSKTRSFRKLEEAGLPLLCVELSRRPTCGPQETIALLGKVLGREARTREIVAYIDAQFDKVASRLDRIPQPPPSIYIEAGNLGPSTYSATYSSGNDRDVSWGSVMSYLRCRNVIGQSVGGMAPTSPEYLIAADPDLIVVTGACWTAHDAMRLGFYAQPAESRRLLAAFTARPGWSGLKAVRNGRVYSVFHGFCMHAGNFSTVQQLAKWLYPDLFADLHPQQALEEFHRRFMPVDCSGVWMIGLDAPADDTPATAPDGGGSP